MEIALLIGLVVLNGIFAMSEIALVTAKKARLSKLAEDGDRAAAVALSLGEDPTKFLSTIQIGITSIGLLNGIVGEAAFAPPFALWLQSIGVPSATATIGATCLVVVVVTYISIVIGELVPKRMGQINAEAVARLVSRPMHLLSRITRPFVLLLSLSTRAALRLLRVQQDTPHRVTEEEIHAVLEEGSEAGVIEAEEHEMVRNVFRLDHRLLGSFMIPRSDVVFVDTQLPDEENLKRLIETEYTRFPVCDGGLEKVLGVIHSKHALAPFALGGPVQFSAQLQPPVFVPETLTGMEVLEVFRENKTEIVFVIDEWGEVEGIVTLQDVFESLGGGFTPNEGEDSWSVRREDGSWLLDGALPLADLKDCLELRTLPEEERNRYHTVSGLVLFLLGKIPSTGDLVEWEGWRLEVVDMDGKRIDKVLAQPVPASAPDPA